MPNKSECQNYVRSVAGWGVMCISPSLVPTSGSYKTPLLCVMRHTFLSRILGPLYILKCSHDVTLIFKITEKCFCSLNKCFVHNLAVTDIFFLFVENTAELVQLGCGSHTLMDQVLSFGFAAPELS